MSGENVKGDLNNGFCQSKTSEKNFTSVKESNTCLTRNIQPNNQNGRYGAQKVTAAEVTTALCPARRGFGVYPGKQGILRFSSKPI